jgi:hypothetical protein
MASYLRHGRTLDPASERSDDRRELRAEAEK